MKYLEVKNFKCFRDIRLPINGLTVLAGANGNGKSSSIQALLLLRSTIERCSKLNIQNMNMRLSLIHISEPTRH